MDRASLRARIGEHESLRLYVYDDATGEEIRAGYTMKGVPTIGYGRALDRNRGITREEAEWLRERDIDIACHDAEIYEWFHELNETRQEVVVEMLYNLGLPRFMAFKRMIGALEREDFHTAANEMKASRWAAQVKGRAVELAEMMERG